MPEKTFAASNLKLERGRYHINYLDREISKFLRRKPFRAFIEMDSPGRRRLTYRVREPVPKIFSAVIGDAVHNLRSALDIMMCDLVRLNNGSVAGVLFPFCDDPDFLEKRILFTIDTQLDIEVLSS